MGTTEQADRPGARPGPSSSTDPAVDHVDVGRIVKPHGIRGEVVVEVLSDLPERLVAGEVVRRNGVEVMIETSRPHQGRLLVKFPDVPDRTTAESLRGQRLTGPAADVSGSDEFYAHELVGCRVRDAAGADLGEVVEITFLPDAAGYDLLEVIHPDGHRWLLPTADDLVEAVEDGNGWVLVVHDAPEGLVFQSGADPVPATAELAAASQDPTEAHPGPAGAVGEQV